MHQKHPLPTRHGDNARANDRAKAQANAENNAPGAEGFTPSSRCLKPVGEHRHLADQHRPCRHALQKTAGNQHVIVGCQAAAQRGDAEQHQADHKHTFTPIPIRQCADGHQHHGAGDGVGIHDPLQIAEITVQLCLEGGQDGRYAGYFEAKHQGCNAHGSQGKSIFLGGREQHGDLPDQRDSYWQRLHKVLLPASPEVSSGDRADSASN